jgi:hypothetical protein
MALQQVHLRINDASTGRPTPVRLRVTDVAGTYYPPHGRPAEFPTGRGEDVGGNLLVGRERWTYSDGACEIALPPGDLVIEARKGPEYEPLRATVHLPAGKLALRFEIKRWTNQRENGWYAGDTRAHFLSPHAALLEAAAEDLAVVNLLACESAIAGLDGNTYPSYSNLLAFSGQLACLESGGHIVAVNTHNRHPVLGSLGLLHCHRIVHPLTFGGADRTDDWSLDDWCGQCHRKNGLVVWTNAFDPAGQPNSYRKAGHAGEALADLILGHVDAIEVAPSNPQWLRAWYQILNAGIRVPIVGASAKADNRTPLGGYRTYARLPEGEALTYTAWINAVRSGHTFVTSGAAAIAFDVDGVVAGGQIQPDEKTRRATATVRALDKLTRLELVVNGAVVAKAEGPTIDHMFSTAGGGWAAVRCWIGDRLLAHTSPVYIGATADFRPSAAAVSFVAGHLDRAQVWVERYGRFSAEKARDHLLHVFDAARRALLARAGLSGTIHGPEPSA